MHKKGKAETKEKPQNRGKGGEPLFFLLLVVSSRHTLRGYRV
jgi:hypothetical protein